MLVGSLAVVLLASTPAVTTNDNAKPAGTLTDRVLTLELRAGAGQWRPQSEDGPALTVEAFGEGASPLSIPAPLSRVREGTEIAASVRNDLTTPLRVHGLCERVQPSCTPLDIPAGEVRQTLQFRGSTDTQLSGVFVVDSAGATAGTDRVLVITEWTSLTRTQLAELAAQPDHPMHLHGFYFDVDSLGGMSRETAFAPDQKPTVVTQVMQPGTTMALVWKPEREGNWLFHCHVMTHVSPTLNIDESPKGGDAQTYDFEFRAPSRRQTLWLEVKTPAGRWHAQGRVIVR